MTKGVPCTLFLFAILSGPTRSYTALDRHFQKQREIYPTNLTPATLDRKQNVFFP